jgi:hypothetical protein
MQQDKLHAGRIEGLAGRMIMLTGRNWHKCSMRVVCWQQHAGRMLTACGSHAVMLVSGGFWTLCL